MRIRIDDKLRRLSDAELKELVCYVPTRSRGNRNKKPYMVDPDLLIPEFEKAWSQRYWGAKREFDATEQRRRSNVDREI